ncbi:DUF1573 domain-containing protein [Flavobacterium sp. CYK-55]|uniref:DUF1573 domain-containing protein n=1 Tax=Flavobacterium sp. CYK-55 TaxID=2835529 RepID=UPI001BD189C5|nr:DUF1573 domain-containing protein [Flavobacterium sp. CYK-55]MBS7787365.1 DUF1573 domain-containing protein [Flavobacterium sp. CYK-55]
MKKIVLLAALAIFGVTASNAQAKKTAAKAATKAATAKVETPKVEGAGMLFESETIDYGTLPHNADGKREFVFVNNGTKPLIITNATGSCGCTVPSFPKEPIAPGAKAIIGVKYATDRVGAFTKTVTVTSNAEGQASKVLTIKGTILPDETPKDTAPKG